MIDKVVLIGGGGHCKSVLDSILSCNDFEVCGIIDTKAKIGNEVCSVPIIGDDNDLVGIFKSGVKYAFVVIGTMGNVTLQKKLFEYIKGIGYMVPTIIDKSAIVAKNSIIGEGVFVGKGTVINSCANIAEMSIINSGAIIEHDCEIGKFVHIAPGVTLSGTVKVGDYSHIGTGTNVIQGVNIGTQSYIGAGSLVLSDIANGTKAFGVPCKEVSKWQSLYL